MNETTYKIRHFLHYSLYSHRIGLTLIFDFCLLILGAILSFSLGIAISVWLSETCKKFEDITDDSRYFADIFILGLFVF